MKDFPGRDKRQYATRVCIRIPCVVRALKPTINNNTCVCATIIVSEVPRGVLSIQEIRPTYCNSSVSEHHNITIITIIYYRVYRWRHFHLCVNRSKCYYCFVCRMNYTFHRVAIKFQNRIDQDRRKIVTLFFSIIKKRIETIKFEIKSNKRALHIAK